MRVTRRCLLSPPQRHGDAAVTSSFSWLSGLYADCQEPESSLLASGFCHQLLLSPLLKRRYTETISTPTPWREGGPLKHMRAYTHTHGHMCGHAPACLCAPCPCTIRVRVFLHVCEHTCTAHGAKTQARLHACAHAQTYGSSDLNTAFCSNTASTLVRTGAGAVDVAAFRGFSSYPGTFCSAQGVDNHEAVPCPRN